MKDQDTTTDAPQVQVQPKNESQPLKISLKEELEQEKTIAEKELESKGKSAELPLKIRLRAPVKTYKTYKEVQKANNERKGIAQRISFYDQQLQLLKDKVIIEKPLKELIGTLKHDNTKKLENLQKKLKNKNYEASYRKKLRGWIKDRLGTQAFYESEETRLETKANRAGQQLEFDVRNPMTPERAVSPKTETPAQRHDVQTDLQSEIRDELSAAAREVKKVRSTEGLSEQEKNQRIRNSKRRYAFYKDLHEQVTINPTTEQNLVALMNNLIASKEKSYQAHVDSLIPKKKTKASRFMDKISFSSTQALSMEQESKANRKGFAQELSEDLNFYKEELMRLEMRQSAQVQPLDAAIRLKIDMIDEILTAESQIPRAQSREQENESREQENDLKNRIALYRNEYEKIDAHNLPEEKTLIGLLNRRLNELNNYMEWLEYSQGSPASQEKHNQFLLNMRVLYQREITRLTPKQMISMELGEALEHSVIGDTVRADMQKDPLAPGPLSTRFMLEKSKLMLLAEHAKDSPQANVSNRFGKSTPQGVGKKSSRNRAV